MRFAYGIPGAFPVVACSFLVDTGDIEGARPAGGDGGSDASAMEDGAGDAVAPPDPDGSSGDASSASGFCAARPDAFFCDDFDSTPLGVLWGDPGPDTSGGGVIGIEPGDARSAPNMLVSRISANAPSCASASVERAFRGSYKAGRATLDLRYQMDPSVATVITVILRQGSSRCSVFYNVEAGKMARYEIFTGQGNRLTTFNVPFAAGSWQTVVIDTDFPAATSTVTVGTVTESLPLLPCPVQSGDVSLRLGLTCEDPSGSAREVRYDNAIFEPR